LEAKLLEVQDLSAKTIAQEQEKQQILASQKQKLKEQVEKSTAELNHSLIELKATQAQLIQKEKMASLGELTAGIAHEIQNPLNFVNNFSEANEELLAELKQEAKAGNTTVVISIADDLEQNQQKITHHGRRADSIVKGMLQHARDSSGEQQPTNINQLADEYIRLSYQGMRAKDKAFSVRIETNFDETVGDLNVVPQEIGRVMLNLLNNAFYAVSEKKKQLNGTYEPVVSFRTEKSGDKVVITVGDNGTGMPPNVAERVFQPFFTTKPTGEGTGLGLSLSYDIITNGYRGTLSVKSTEGEGSSFVVELHA
jgi:C4-dicarboxylate-specific signal transduction histidine kinase